MSANESVYAPNLHNSSKDKLSLFKEIEMTHDMIIGVLIAIIWALGVGCFLIEGVKSPLILFWPLGALNVTVTYLVIKIWRLCVAIRDDVIKELDLIDYTGKKSTEEIE